MVRLLESTPSLLYPHRQSILRMKPVHPCFLHPITKSLKYLYNYHHFKQRRRITVNNFFNKYKKISRKK
jgi:hypothetical protein